ncbi:MAG: hypothetical protein HY240_09925 [Actinobacteria bacterium]|nr:hypothetical protein [Actinomycetota bacterium]
MQSSPRNAPGRITLTMDHVWVVVALVVPVISVLVASMSTVDLAYHLRAGDWMLRTHRLLDVDTFTFSAGGAAWLNQQLGAQVLLDLAYRAGGFAALGLLRGLLSAVAYGAVFLACRQAGASLRRAALLTTLAFLLSLYHLAMRPQMFGVALFCVTMWLVAIRRKRPRLLWVLLPLVAVWANIHGSFVLAPVLLGLAWLEDIRDHDPVARRTLLVTGGSLAASLVNPFGWRVWAYAVEIGTNPTVRNLIVEWKPTTLNTWAGGSFFVSVAALVVYLARREQQVPWLTLLRLAFFFFLALPAIRGVLWWGLVAPVALAEMLPRSERTPRLGIPAANAAIVVALLAVVVLVVPRGDHAFGGTPLLTERPAGLSDQVEARLPPGSRLFVSQVWGSWFELAVPSMPVYVDSRIEIYPESVWNDYFAISGAQQGWQQILDRYHVDAAVLKESQSGPLIGWMRIDPAWKLVYQDKDGYLFVRVTR